MAIAPVKKYNNLEKNLFSAVERQWDDLATGSNMFMLATNVYTPDVAHQTTNDVTGKVISGDGIPIAVLSPSIDSVSVAGTTSFSSAAANFGAAVTITAKYLICIQPLVANTFSLTTSKLLWYVDLDDTNATASLSSTASDFIINAPTNGWFSIT